MVILSLENENLTRSMKEEVVEGTTPPQCVHARQAFVDLELFAVSFAQYSGAPNSSNMLGYLHQLVFNSGESQVKTYCFK